MEKDEAETLLKRLIDAVKLTKSERDALYKAIEVLHGKCS
jgi:hypothetical protein